MKNIVWLLLLSISVSLQTPENVARKTEEKLRSFKSLQANFEHSYYSSSVSTPLKERGRFYFKKPGLMKWEYKGKEERTYLIKDGFFWEYIPEDNQITKYDMSKESDESEILLILSGQKGLLDNYSVEFSPFPTENKKAKQIKLTPKDEETDSFILLEINEKTWLIQKTVFFDWAGNKTEFIFSRIKTNINLYNNTFNLNAPPGVEIIENK